MITSYNNTAVYCPPHAVAEPLALPLPRFTPIDKTSAITAFNATINSLELSQILIRNMTDDNPVIKASLTKKEGYFTRLFSHENWQEWTEYRTPLGRVVDLFNDFLETGFSTQLLMKRLDHYTLQKASEQAHIVLEELNKPCLGHLTIGALASSVTAQPLPLIFSSFSCLENVHAHKTAAQRIEENRNKVQHKIENAKKGLSTAGDASTVHATEEEAAKAAEESLGKIIKDIVARLPEDYKAITRKFRIPNLIRTFLQYVVKRPSKILENELIPVHIYYWELVYAEYKKKFGEIAVIAPYPRDSQIEQMINKMKQYGFDGRVSYALEFMEKLNRGSENCILNY